MIQGVFFEGSCKKMDITDFLKEVNHWGMIAVCVCGIVVLVSYLFKVSVNEKIRIGMTVTAIIFLAGLIVCVLLVHDESEQNGIALNKVMHSGIPTYQYCFRKNLMRRWRV